MFASNQDRVVAIIPARGGSKVIPRKNVVLLAGKPLIAYTIETALQAPSLERVIVSTDDEEIAAIARKHGAEVPFLRPKELAADDTPDLPVFRHAIQWLRENEGYDPGIVLNLRPTAPLRSVADIEAVIRKLLETGCDAVRTVCRVEHHPYRMVTLENDRAFKLMDDVAPKFSYQRQMLPPVYRWNGAVDAMRSEIILQRDNMYGNDVRVVVMPKERSIDIDDEFDLKIAECLLGRSENRLHPRT